MSAIAIFARRRASWFTTYMVIACVLKVMQLFAESLRTTDGLLIPTLADHVAWKADELLRILPTLPVYALTLHAIERLPLAGARRLVCAVVLVLACALVSAGLSTVVFSHDPVAVRVGASASVAAWFWYSLWANILVGMLAVAAADRLRERQRAVEHLSATQEVSRIIRQRLAQTRLMAIQARVDPQLVFDMLGAVKRFYAHDTTRAERLLDELTTFLRAALSRLRSERSSLEVEFGLVTAHVQLLRTAFNAPITLQTSLPAPLSDAVLPAGLLLPLVTQLLNRSGAESRIDIAASTTDDRVLVRISSAVMPDDRSIDRVRAALSDVYDERAHLRVVRATGTVEIEVPREHE